MTNNAFSLLGHDLFGDPVRPSARGVISDRFVLPPFTVLDARSGPWQERKQAWLGLGIQSEVGRDDDLTYTGAARPFDFYRVKEGTRKGTEEQGTSIFDPTLCELMYRWFAPAGGTVVDPFAGGSVRGIVAGSLGLRYWGCDLSAAQISANNEQAERIDTAVRPEWVVGDSIETLADVPSADFVFSCPPYGDLERYSDDPRDLSSMEWHTFEAAYKRVVLRAVGRLAPDSFACFVVGDFRDSKGHYRNFVSKTIEAFEMAGARLYNEAVLITPVGTAAMRVGAQFESGRKLAKTHQNVLVFVKGNWKVAAAQCENGSSK